MSTTAKKCNQRNDRVTELSGKAGVLRQQRIPCSMGAGHAKMASSAATPRSSSARSRSPAPGTVTSAQSPPNAEPGLGRATLGSVRASPACAPRAPRASRPLRRSATQRSATRLDARGPNFPQKLCAAGWHEVLRCTGGPDVAAPVLPFPFPPAAHPRPRSRTCGRCHRRRRRCGWCSTRSRRRPRRPPCPPPAPRVCRSPAGSAPRPRTASAQRRGRPEGRSPAEHRRSALPEPPAGRCPRRARARAAARSHCRCRSRWRPPITARPAAARGSAGRSACREGRRQQQVPGSWEAERGRERCALNAHRHDTARLGSARLPSPPAVLPAEGCCGHGKARLGAGRGPPRRCSLCRCPLRSRHSPARPLHRAAICRPPRRLPPV